LKAPFFYGEYFLNLDSKNRLLIPSEIRRLIRPEVNGEAFFVTQRGPVPWLYPERYYEQLVRLQIKPAVSPNEDLLAFAQLRFALASRVEWDFQGRIVLPEKLVKRAALGKEVTLLGMQDHLEIWNRTEWDARYADLVARSASIEQRAQEVLKEISPGGDDTKEKRSN
jgi:MraZ protein